jgi:hypothetical protein
MAAPKALLSKINLRERFFTFPRPPLNAAFVSRQPQFISQQSYDPLLKEYTSKHYKSQNKIRKESMFVGTWHQNIDLCTSQIACYQAILKGWAVWCILVRRIDLNIQLKLHPVS